MSTLSVADAVLRDPAALLLTKVTAVLILASGVGALARGLSAARRHILWLTALSSCVFLALSSPIVPAILIHAPVLAPRMDSARIPSSLDTVTRSVAATIARSPHRGDPPTRAGSVWRAPMASMPLPAHPLLALWVIGCVALLARDAMGWTRAMHLARRADASAVAGATGHFVVAYSAEAESPITVGIVKPVVLLPNDARSWSDARLRAVLVHEAAHVCRHDCVSQAIGRAACALFWFHPLAWRAFARLRADAEHAADDCVLDSGIPALDYASYLLDLARDVAAITDASLDVVAVGMLTQSDLERRFRSMFDRTRSRVTVTPRARAATIAFALVMVGPLASIRVAAPADHPDFSGKWSSDTTWIQTLQFDWRVTDSLRITQTANAISLDGRGHIMGTLTHMLSQTHFAISNVAFDGAARSGVTATGSTPIPVSVRAAWAGDTLILTTRAGHGDDELYTIERWTLSADRNTLFDTNRSFVDGKDLWRVKTSTLHRMAQKP